MRILVDARPAAFPERTGVGIYTWELLRRLPVLDPDTTYLAWYLDARGTARRGGLFGRSAPPNLVPRAVPIPARWFEPVAGRLRMPRLEWMARFDLVFAPNFLPPPTAVDRLVVTVHDLAFRLFPGTAPGRTLRWLHRAEQGFHRARRIIAVSDCTKGDLLATYGIPDDRVEVIPHGVDHEVFRPPPPGSSGSMGPRLGVEGPYLLFLGGIEPRKNLPTLLRAYARLPENVRPALILAGSGVPWNPEGRDQLEAALRDLPGHAADRVVVTGYVPESEKVHLLQGAAALVYPSLYEGFGLPVLEAMACGTPVLTSNASALPEVAGDAALLVDPRNTDAIEEGMEKLLTNQDLRARLREAGLARAQGFTWDETARRTMNVLHRAGRA